MNQRLEQINAALTVLQSEKADILAQESEKANAEKIEQDRKQRLEIADLVDKINAEEQEQGQRLARLFYLIKGREGSRQVSFSNGHGWTPGDWHGPDRTDRQHHIDKLLALITDIEPGV